MDDPTPYCGRCWRPITGTGCGARHRILDGKIVRRNVYAQVFFGMPKRCNDCATPAGRPHHEWCDQDICPVCQQQAVTCRHINEGWPRLTSRGTTTIHRRLA